MPETQKTGSYSHISKHPKPPTQTGSPSEGGPRQWGILYCTSTCTCCKLPVRTRVSPRTIGAHFFLVAQLSEALDIMVELFLIPNNQKDSAPSKRPLHISPIDLPAVCYNVCEHPIHFHPDHKARFPRYACRLEAISS